MFHFIYFLLFIQKCVSYEMKKKVFLFLEISCELFMKFMRKLESLKNSDFFLLFCFCEKKEQDLEARVNPQKTILRDSQCFKNVTESDF